MDIFFQTFLLSYGPNSAYAVGRSSEQLGPTTENEAEGDEILWQTRLGLGV